MGELKQVKQTPKRGFTNKITALAVGAFAFVNTSIAMAAIDYSGAKTEITGEVDAAESFGVEIGLSILGFIAVISVLRHVRGAVK